MRQRGQTPALARTRTQGVSGDYAAALFCQAFGWAIDSSAGRHHAIDKEGVRYQIRARQLTRHGHAPVIRPIRNLDKRPFDHLAVVIVDDDFGVVRAATMPIEMVLGRALHAGTDIWKLPLPAEIWTVKAVRDVTDFIGAAAMVLT